MNKVIVTVMLLLFISCEKQISFNSNLWKKGQNRKLMTDDLNEILRNKKYTYNEIILLLGQPELGQQNQAEIAYHIESGFGLEVKLLSFYFENELVVSYDIAYHD